MKRGSTPDWDRIFRENPSLESPGYQEVVGRLRQRDASADPMKLQMERIHKQRQSDRNKARRKPSNRTSSVMPNSVNSLLGVNKGGGKNR